MRVPVRTSVCVLLRGTFLAVLCAIAFGMVAMGQDGVQVRPAPDALGLATSAEGAVALRFENVQDLYGVEAHLTFDPAIVEVVDADPSKSGVQVHLGEWLNNSFVAVNQADNSAGKIDIAATLVNPAPPVSGEGNIATITFRGKVQGISPLTLESIILVTRDSDVIASQSQNGRIGVSADGRFPETEPSAPAAAGAAQTADAASSSPFPAGLNLLNLVTFLSIVAFLIALATFVYAVRGG